MSCPESNGREPDRAGFDARAIVAVALLVGFGCVAQRDLASYSEGAAPEESASLVPAPAGGPADLDASPAEAAPGRDGAEPTPVATAEVDETGAADAPLAPANAGNPEPSTPAPSDASPVAPPPAVDASDSCMAMGGFTISETDSCYMLGDTVFNWQDARNYCQAWGGDLVQIASPQENAALAERIDRSVWIGANDQEAEGTFRWADGAPLGFAAWLANQPNDLGGNEDCTELTPFAGRWADLPCAVDMARPALCERR